MGPGMGTSAGAHSLVKTLVDSADKPAVFDADALNVLAKVPAWSDRYRDNWVLTPHPGEWQRLSGVPASDRAAQVAAAKKFAVTSGAVVLLKGASTVVTDGDRQFINPTGNPGMATAGCGDCLTGVIVSLLGQGFSCWDSTVLGAWVHGLAGDIAAETWGQAGMTAVEIADSLPAAIDFLAGPLL
jgi:NAD(P)H-hydrate epimerase